MDITEDLVDRIVEVFQGGHVRSWRMLYVDLLDAGCDDRAARELIEMYTSPYIVDDSDGLD
jgi:hypothetical protein